MGFKNKVFWGYFTKFLGQGKGSCEIELLIEGLNELGVDIRVFVLFLQDNWKYQILEAVKVTSDQERGNQVSEDMLAFKLNNVKIGIMIGFIQEELCEKTQICMFSGSWYSEPVNEGLVKDPGLMIHVLLIGVRLLREELVEDLLHLRDWSELKSVFLTIEKDLTRKKTPEDLKDEVSLLLSGKDLFQSEKVLLSIYKFSYYIV